MPAVPVPTLFEKHGVFFNSIETPQRPLELVEEALKHLDAAVNVEQEWAGQYTSIRAAQARLAVVVALETTKQEP